MYQRILVAYNDSPESRAALQACIGLAPPPTTQVHLVGVIHLGTYLLAGEHVCEAVLAAEKQKMEASLQESAQLLERSGIPIKTHLEIGEPIDVIKHLVEALHIQLVIVGHARNKPLSLRWWRGSADAVLVEKLHCNVLVAADQPV